MAQRYLVFGQLLPTIGLLPAGIGAFWGAPLLGREFENGTTHFAWTQSVSRRTWMLTRFAVLGALIAIGAFLLGIALDYWLSAFSGFDLPGGCQTDYSFSHMRGTAPVGWWLLAFSLGAASGALLRRTVPAMVVTHRRHGGRGLRQEHLVRLRHRRADRLGRPTAAAHRDGELDRRCRFTGPGDQLVGRARARLDAQRNPDKKAPLLRNRYHFN